MLTLLELLQAKNVPLGKFKIHLAQKSEIDDPLDAFFAGTFQRWQEAQNRRNFNCDTVLGLIDLGSDQWLFAGVYRVLGYQKGIKNPYLYQTELLPDQEDLIGRVIVHFNKNFRSCYVWGKNYGDRLEVAEIRPRRMTVCEFPGYHKVILSHQELCILVAQQEPGWKAALANVQGVYLITDRSNGKHYVGCTYGQGSIWDRWSSYAQTGHGGNMALRALVENDAACVESFQYSLLEIADLNASEADILECETYWKEALLTRQHGYNAN